MKEDEASARQASESYSHHCLSLSKRPFQRKIMKRVYPIAPVPTRIASVVIVSEFCSPNHRIRTKKRPSATIQDSSHVNMVNGCLTSQAHSLDLNCLVSYNGTRHIVAGWRRVLYWLQLLNISFLLRVNFLLHTVST